MPLKQVDMLGEALRLLELGWWLVPQDGKRAVALGWHQWQLSADDLREYLAPGRLNIAVELMNSGLVDVECDSDEAEGNLQRLMQGEPEALRTPTWRSRRGLHRLYLRPEGLPNKAKVEARGIEFRLGNQGALSTLPPSVHPDTGKRYRWIDGLSPFEVKPLPLPKVMVDLIRREAPKQAKRMVEASLNGKIPEGGRNTALMMLSRRLVRVGLDHREIASTVAQHNIEHCDPPLDDAEVLSILDGACRVKDQQDAVRVMPEMCCSWADLIAAWEDALFIRQDIKDALASLLAVAISTDQVGDQQLFLQLVADAGSAKTRLCDAMLVSENCKLFEQVTGLTSGWKVGTDGKDFSFINRINHKMLITPEGDTIFAHPKFPELMAQFRRAYDGTLSATYKNSDVDMRWEGLRIPWAVACTPVGAHTTDQSRLGDRFIRIYIDQPSEEVKRNIQRAVLRSELQNVKTSCNSSPESQLNPRMLKAYKLTGGYVDHLRINAERLLSGVVMPEAAEDRIMDFADFAAHLRSQPDFDKRKADHDSHKELPSRLTAQFGRFAVCLAAVLGRPEVDGEVLRIVAKAAKDTSRGKPYNIALCLAHGDNQSIGVHAESLAIWTGTTEERMATWLNHMKKIKAVRQVTPKRAAGIDCRPRWFLTDQMLRLWREVVG